MMFIWFFRVVTRTAIANLLNVRRMPRRRTHSTSFVRLTFRSHLWIVQCPWLSRPTGKLDAHQNAATTSSECARD